MMQVEIEIGTKYNTVPVSLYEVTRILEYCIDVFLEKHASFTAKTANFTS